MSWATPEVSLRRVGMARLAIVTSPPPAPYSMWIFAQEMPIFSGAAVPQVL